MFSLIYYIKINFFKIKKYYFNIFLSILNCNFYYIFKHNFLKSKTLKILNIIINIDISI